MDYYSFNQPRRDGWLSWRCWLTDSGRFTHKVVTRPDVSLAQNRESSPARTGGLTTMLRHQLLKTDLALWQRKPSQCRQCHFTDLAANNNNNHNNKPLIRGCVPLTVRKSGTVVGAARSASQASCLSARLH